MNRMTINTLALMVALLSGPVMADEVLAQVADTTAGAALGVSTGVMIGGAAGGPLGALIGAGVGLVAGKLAQQASGLEETAYAVRTEQGDITHVRSPSADFRIGQQVERQGNRLYAMER